MSDKRNYSGVFYSGYRTVKKDGIIKIDRDTWKHPELIKYRGDKVWCRMGASSEWADGPLHVYHDVFGRSEICKIEHSEEYK